MRSATTCYLAGMGQNPKACYICGVALSKGGDWNRNHVIPKGWFGDPKPPNLLTLHGCRSCNNALSPREERLRNAFVRMYSHSPKAHEDARQKAERSLQPALRAAPTGFVKTPLGVHAKSLLLEMPTEEDVNIVFSAITRGLYFKHLGELLARDVPMRALLMQSDDADKWTREAAIHVPRYQVGDEFFYAPLVNQDDATDSAWLYLVFNAGIVGCFTGPRLRRISLRPASFALGPLEITGGSSGPR